MIDLYEFLKRSMFQSGAISSFSSSATNPKSTIQNPKSAPLGYQTLVTRYQLLATAPSAQSTIQISKSRIQNFLTPSIPPVAVFATTPASGFVEMILPLFKIQHHRFRRPRRLLQQRQAGENHFVEVTDMVEREAQRSKKPLMMSRYDCYFIAGMNAQFAESRKLETTVCSNLERLGHAH